MTAIRWGDTTLPSPASSKRALLVVLGVAAVVAYLLFNGQWTLPHDDDADIFRALNSIKDVIADNRQILDPIRIGVTSLVDLFDEILASLGWTGVIALVAALGLLFGGIRLALLAGLGFAFIGVLGLWDEAMATLGVLLAAVVIALIIGLPLGIAAGRSNRLNAILSPILDVMQIMPTLAYLAPLTLLFLIGSPSSTVATLIYALPAAIRITALGIRGVPHDTVEAASRVRGDRHADAAQGRAAAGAPRHRARDQPDHHAQPVDGHHRRPDRRPGPRPEHRGRAVQGRCRDRLRCRASRSSSWPSSSTA